MVYPVFYNVLHPKDSSEAPTAARLLRTVSLMAAPMVPGRWAWPNKWGIPNSWMVYFMKNPVKMDGGWG